jgi:hypothetical protein
MKNGVCPKCDGSEVYYHPGSSAVTGEAIALDAGVFIHVRSIYQKLGVSSRTAAAIWARERGLMAGE